MMPTFQPTRSDPEPQLTKQDFRDVMGRFASGVTVITTRTGEQDFGTTASAVSSLSDEPPMLLICLNRSSSTARAILESGTFAVNVLAEDHAAIAGRFASKVADKFEGIGVTRAADGAPLLTGAIAHLMCRVKEPIEAATHFVFIAFVVDAVAAPGNPLAYFRGTFGRMETAPDAAAMRATRDHVISVVSDESVRLDLGAMAETLALEPGRVQRALSALAAEGVVVREGGTYIVEPIPEPVLFDYYAAKLAIEIGAAQMTVGRLGPAELLQLRSLMETTVELVESTGFVDATRWIEANSAFHTHLVGLAGSRILIESYDRLGLQGLDRRTITATTYATAELSQDHRDIVDAYEAGDLDRVVSALRRHADRPRQLRAIEHGRPAPAGA